MTLLKHQRAHQRGRPKSDPDNQRAAIFDATTSVLLSAGYQKATTLSIAKTCGISKHTLYAHFPSKEALFIALIEDRTAALNQILAAALADTDLDLETVLKRFGRLAVGILNSDVSVAINQAAISAASSKNEDLALAYFKHGHEPIRGKITALLQRSRASGILVFDNIDVVFQTLFGLYYGDLQMRRLLGVIPALTDQQVADKVDGAVDNFLVLYAPPIETLV